MTLKDDFQMLIAVEQHLRNKAETFVYNPKMLGIPFLSSYIQKIVKEQQVADSADWLNYYCTSLMLAFFSLAISAKQYFGSAIKCWTPNEFKGGWDKYAEDYCFISNSYYVPDDEEVPTDLSLRVDKISYYRWVPIMLAIQALLFWLPNWLWNMLHKQTAINPRAIVNEALRTVDFVGKEREKEVEALAEYIVDVLSVFHRYRGSKTIPRSGYNATVLYLGIKLLYVCNAIGQLIILNQFLGGEYFAWGYSQVSNLVHGQDWKESQIFPRVIMCDFVVRRLANAQRHTIQCVIMMNMINEKLYFFLYFWFLFVGLSTLINFIYYLIVLSIPYFRTKFVLFNINRKEQKLLGIKGNDLNRFVQKFLCSDGVLLLQFIRQHIGGRVTYDLLNELLRIYWIKECHHIDDENTTTTKSSPISDQTPRNNGNHNNNIMHSQVHFCSNNDSTYKSTLYGPSGLYPLSVCNPLLHEHSEETANELPQKSALPAKDFFDSNIVLSQNKCLLNTEFQNLNAQPNVNPATPLRQKNSGTPSILNISKSSTFANAPNSSTNNFNSPQQAVVSRNPSTPTPLPKRK